MHNILDQWYTDYSIVTPFAAGFNKLRGMGHFCQHDHGEHIISGQGKARWQIIIP